MAPAPPARVAGPSPRATAADAVPVAAAGVVAGVVEGVVAGVGLELLDAVGAVEAAVVAEEAVVAAEAAVAAEAVAAEGGDEKGRDMLEWNLSLLGR